MSFQSGDLSGHHFKMPIACLPHLLRKRLRVNIHRSAGVCVPHQALRNFDIRFNHAQIRSQRVPETVPTDYLSLDACPL